VKIVNWLSTLPRTLIFGGLLIATILLFTNFLGLESKGVDFNTQVKPILNKNCITCHGGVKVKGGFNMMTREDILAPTESGKPAIVVGDAEASDMYKRLITHDMEERMPYKKEALSEKEIAIVHDWIEEGAKWGNHWAYNPIEVPSVPKPKGAFFGLFSAPKIDWVKNDLDFFIYDKLKKNNLTPSVQADKNTLLRRVSLDLIGMPASENLQKQFLQDPSVKSYEILVDSLLASPHFGERWAAMWLDLARYADTKGYERDDSRNIWRYRDWLIKAFNKGMPYNQFLTEQLAGDLIPNATDDQLIATAFHRNTMTNDEGGTDNEEFRTAAVIDRVNTTWETLMGTTFACTQCHGHPYEPFKHEEYYQFMAFFNNTRDEDTYEDYPLLRHFSQQDSTDFLTLKSWLSSNFSPEKAAHFTNLVKTWQPTIPSLKADKMTNSELYDTKWLGLRHNAVCRLPQVVLDNKTQLLYRYNSKEKGGIWTIHLDSVGGKVLTTIKLDTSGKKIIKSVDFQPVIGTHDLYFTYKNPNLKPDQAGVSFDWFHFGEPFPKNGKTDGDAAFALYWKLLNATPKSTPIMLENNADLRRETYVFERGNWMVKGQKVEPKIPRVFPQLPKDAPTNRLSLAQWLVDKKHPLTARTAVNRFWEQLFGIGLVETLEDMGSQGFLPTHPELLDWLAYNFMNEQNWDVKKLLKTIVMSATYQQDSKSGTPQYLALDPDNKLYSRFSRVRLSAEQVRDQALQVCGLMSEKMYGESVMPFQPHGIWQSPWNGKTWTQSKGEDQYRRAIYTYWKRSSPYPSMMTFDGVPRELCTARRIRTNTPLQALVTLNDSAYIEMARQNTFKILKNQEATETAKVISKSYEIAIGKSISPQKLESLVKLYQSALNTFKADKKKTLDFLGNGDTYKKPEVAALVVVNNAIFNLDEFVTKN
jgi:hypothetical protein